MALTMQELNEATYKALRYPFIKQVEESGQVSLTGYVDSKGIPTIGLGFNLRTHLNVVLQRLGITDLSAAYEAQYVTRLQIIVTATYPDTATDEATLRDALNDVMSDRASDANVPGVKRATFSFADEDEVKVAFAEIARDVYEDRIAKWESANSLGIQPDSYERLALFSLAYNTVEGATSLLGSGLANAIKQSNRAEAWYEIRYNSNREKDGGVAKRRYEEAALFGLYDADGLSTEEAMKMLQMLQLHRTRIESYERDYGSAIAEANADLTALAAADAGFDEIRVQALALEFENARAMVTADLAARHQLPASLLNTIAATNIYLDPGRDSTTQSLNPNHPYTLNSTRRDAQGNEIASDDLLIGEGGRDTLTAGAGSDILIGGAGDDALQGGAGADTYVYHAGDGADTILDLDGLGAIRLNGSVLTGAMCTLTPHPQYRDKRVWRAELDGQEVFIIEWSGDIATGATLRIEGAALGAGGRIEIQDFNNGELGVTLDPTNRLQFEVATASLSEGHALTVPLQLAGPVREGQRVRIAVSALSESLRWAA